MVGLLVVTGWLNIMLNTWGIGKNNDDTPTGGSQLNFFEQFRIDRIATMDQTRMHLETIVNNPASTPEAVESALAEIENLAKVFNQEVALETIIKALGFSDVAVTNALVNLTVMVQAEEISQEQSDKILHAVVSETNRDPIDVRLLTI